MSLMDYGAVRQIFVDDNAAGTTKKTFLIRDDAYSKASAVLGRTLRLGDPIDTGPSSAVTQTDWSGGFGQNVFSDESMFYDSNMDTTSPLGFAQPWEGYTAFVKGAATTTAYYSAIYTVGGATPGSEIMILGGSGGTVSSVDTAGVVTARNGGASIGGTINCIAPMAETGTNTASKVVMGTSTGKLFQVDYNTWTFTDISHPTITGQPITAIVPYKGKLAILMGNALYTRDAGATWLSHHTFNEDVYTHKMALSGNTLYILTSGYGPYTKAYISDTTTTSLLYTWDYANGGDVLAYNGVIYFYVKRWRNGGGQTNPSLFQYNGSSMRLLHDRSDWDIWGEYNQVDNVSLATYKNMIAFSYTGGTETAKSIGGGIRFGFMLYDPVKDALHCGPSLDNTGDITGTAMCEYRDGIAFAVKTDVAAGSNSYRHVLHTNLVSQIEDIGFSGIGGGNLAARHNAVKKHYIRSSNFDSNLPFQDKVWMSLSSNFLVDANFTYSIDHYADVAFCDPNPTGTFNSSTITASYCQLISMNDEFIGFPSAKTFAYTFKLTASSGIVTDYAINSLSLKYVVSPTALKVWRVRVLCSDGQRTLGGAANSLTTANAQAEHLYNLWANGRPFYWWEPTTSDSWVGTNLVVMITDYLESSFRIDTESDEVIKEISLTLYQIQ